MRSRALLHKADLSDYAEFCGNQGWIADATPLPAFQVLRMRLGKRILIVYERLDAKEHFTLYGESYGMGQKFYRSKRAAKNIAG